MNTITFRGAELKSAEICRPKKGAPYVRAHFTSELTEPVAEAMGWDDIPECIDGAKLSGFIGAKKLNFEPNDKELREWRIELECSELTDFAVFRIEKKKTGAVRTELRFVARSNQEGAEGLLATWMRTIGAAGAVLKVAYDSAGKQEELPMEEGEKDTGCVSCNNDIPLMDGDPTKHASGAKCTRTEGAATQAAAAEAQAKAGKEARVQ